MGSRVSVQLVVRRLWSSEHLGSARLRVVLYIGYRQFALCCDLLGLSDRPNLNSSKRARNLASIRISKASNLASNKPTDVGDICRKMAAERSKSGGSSDRGGRRGQQQCRLRLRCDFVATGGSETSLLIVFTSMLAAVKIVGSERLLWAAIVVQREMRATVEGIREIGWLKCWWTEGGRLRFFGACFVAVLGAVWGCDFGEVFGL
ncbi:hypothetical protein BHE74_00049053 [Ensete ventricosum]|nr:hypothetical protein BHE74_00049053 [Ensete ventricosum]